MMKVLFFLILVPIFLIASTITNLSTIRIVNLHSYPNPFDNETQNAKIKFTLESQPNFKGSVNIYIIITDLQGKKVWLRKYGDIQLPNSKSQIFEYIWAGENDYGIKVANGIYYLEIIAEAGNTAKSKFKVLVK